MGAENDQQDLPPEDVREQPAEAPAAEPDRKDEEEFLDLDSALTQHKEELEAAELALATRAGAEGKVPKAWLADPTARQILAWANKQVRERAEEAARKKAELEEHEQDVLAREARSRRLTAAMLEEPKLPEGAPTDAVLKAMREANERRQSLAQQVVDEERARESEALRRAASKQSEKLFGATRDEAKTAGLDPEAAAAKQREIMERAFKEAKDRGQDLLFSTLDELRSFHEQTRSLAIGQLVRERMTDRVRTERANMRGEVTGRVSTQRKSGLEVPDYGKDRTSVYSFIADTMPE